MLEIRDKRKDEESAKRVSSGGGGEGGEKSERAYARVRRVGLAEQTSVCALLNDNPVGHNYDQVRVLNLTELVRDDN